MKKSLLTLLILLVCTFQRSLAYEYFVIYFNDGTKSEAFYASDVESIGYSKTDLDGFERDSWQVQEIQTIDSLYRYSLASIKYIDFKEGDMNKVIEDIAEACTAITPIYAQCETIDDIAQHLSEIKSAKGVEDAWISNLTLYVKIKDWETITYSFFPDYEPFDGVFAQEDLTQAQAKERSKAPDSGHQDYTDDIKNMLVINQPYYDEGREEARKAQKFFVDLASTREGVCVDTVNRVLPEFFLKDIYDYDFVFLMTHGSYNEKTGVHWLLTGEQLYVANEDGVVDKNAIWSKARMIFEKKYPITKENLDLANYCSFGACKETRGGKKVTVFYSKISNKLIAASPYQFAKKGKVVVFNTSCQSLKGNDNLAQAFFKRGAGLYLGYDESNNCGHVAGNGFFAGLLNGKSSYVSYLSIPKRFRDYTSENIRRVLRRIENPNYQYDICITQPISVYGDYISEEGATKAVLCGEMNAYKPLCDFYQNKSCNAEVYKNSYGFLYSDNPDMTDAKKITIDIKPDETNVLDGYHVGDDYVYNDDSIYWLTVIDEQELQSNTTYYYCAYMNDGLYDCYGDIKKIDNGVEPYTVWDKAHLTVTFYYDENCLIRGGTKFIDGSPHILECEKVVFDPSFAKYSPVSTASWFTLCYDLRTIENLQYLNTSNVTDMSDMFKGCESLTSLDLSSFNTANVTDMSEMFKSCESLTSLNLSSFNTANVTDMSDMFASCESLISLDLSSFNTANVTDMSKMFWLCYSLISLDLSSFNTANVTDMSYMFDGCISLISLNLSSFNTANVTDMSQMFTLCRSLISLDLSSFNTANVTDMSEMFLYCNSLTSIDFRNLYLKDYVGDGLFNSLRNLQHINLDNANTSNATSLRDMFRDCESLESLDLSSFDTQKVKFMTNMFSYCKSLKTIYASDWTDDYRSELMFYQCGNLVGERGTKIGNNPLYDQDGKPCYDEFGNLETYSCPDNRSAAHIDGGEDWPGLFTEK